MKGQPKVAGGVSPPSPLPLSPRRRITSVGVARPARPREVAFRAGVNEIVVELVGKDARSAGYGEGFLVGIEGFLLTVDR